MVPGPDVIVPMVNGEPVALVDALEANHERLQDVRLHVPRTFGLNQLHVSQVLGFCESERPLVEVAPAVPTSATRPSRRASSSGSPTGATRLHLNASVEMLPVDWVNDPRVIARERDFVSINATTGVDLYGQCASETIAGRYWSSSGGQADFARGAMCAEGGQAFIVLRSVTSKGRSRIRVRLTEGSVVTTLKNTSTTS